MLSLARSGVCLLLLAAYRHSFMSGRRVIGPKGRGEAEGICSISMTAQSTCKRVRRGTTRTHTFSLLAKFALSSPEPSITVGSLTVKCEVVPHAVYHRAAGQLALPIGHNSLSQGLPTWQKKRRKRRREKHVWPCPSFSNFRSGE